jgi:LysR family glycine cleavage system transcriptional activator
MTVRMPPLNALRAFEAAARTLSFKRAAGELAVTPTAVSHQIKQLEEAIGQPLFRRMPRAIALTPAGAAMLPLVSEGFSCLRRAIETVLLTADSGVVTVCAPPSFAARWLVPRLGDLAKAHPEIELRLSSSLAMIDNRDAGSPRERNPDAANTLAYDLAVRFGRGNYPGNEVACLFSPAIVAVCSPTLLQGRHALRRPEDLRWHTLIQDTTVADLDDRPGWPQWLSLAGVADIVTQGRGPSFADAALAVEAAIAGHGVALAARPLVSADLAVGRLAMPFPTSIPSRYAYYVLATRDALERPATAIVRDWLIREAATEAAENDKNSTSELAAISLPSSS